MRTILLIVLVILLLGALPVALQRRLGLLSQRWAGTASIDSDNSGSDG